MALGHGPTVVTNGLVLALDAADRNSYPGSAVIRFLPAPSGCELPWAQVWSHKWSRKKR
jgi:hypothetical protein